MVQAVHTHFSARTLDELRCKLVARRDAIARCLESLELELSDAAAHRDCSDLHDEAPQDDADLSTDRLLVAQAQRAFEDTEAALARLDRGTYGSCRTCGRFIPLVRLRALPDTENCVTCSRAVTKHAPDHEDWDEGWVALG